MKEVKRLKQKNIPDSWNGSLSTVKMAVPPNWSTDSIQSQWILVEMNELVPEFIWKCRGVRVSKAILGREKTKRIQIS